MKGRDRTLILWLRAWRSLNPARRRWMPLRVWWWLQPPIRVYAHTVAVLVVAHFRWRDDDGSESAATWLFNEDVDATDLALDTNYRLRITIDDTASGVLANVNPQLQYNVGGAGWNDVNAASSNVRSSASGNFAEDDDTTRQLTIPTGGTFITPNSGMDEVEGLAGEANDIDFVEGTHDFVEVEYCFQFRSADLTGGESVAFRITVGGSPLTLNVTPDATLATTPVSLSGSGPNASDGKGTLTRNTLALAGSGPSASDGTGTITVYKHLSGSGANASEGTADITVFKNLSGSGANASDGVGTLTVTSGGPVPLSSSAPNAADGTGDLTLTLAMSGSGPSASDGTGTLSPTRGLSGSGPNASESTANLTLTLALAGSGANSSAGSGLLSTGAVDLSGSGPNASAGTANLTLSLVLAGSGGNASEGTADITVFKHLSATTGPAASAGTAALNLTVVFAGSGPSSNAGTAALDITRGLAGSGANASQGSGVLTIAGATWFSPNPRVFAAAVPAHTRMTGDDIPPPWT